MHVKNGSDMMHGLENEERQSKGIHTTSTWGRLEPVAEALIRDVGWVAEIGY
jgi:hypothetical protein